MPKAPTKKKPVGRRRLTDDDLRDKYGHVILGLRSGHTWDRIMDDTGVSRMTVAKIAKLLRKDDALSGRPPQTVSGKPVVGSAQWLLDTCRATPGLARELSIRTPSRDILARWGTRQGGLVTWRNLPRLREAWIAYVKHEPGTEYAHIRDELRQILFDEMGALPAAPAAEPAPKAEPAAAPAPTPEQDFEEDLAWMS